MLERVHFRDVRCFHGEHIVPLAPLTLLVGENSTGKSTFLAACRAAWDIARGKADIDFNEDPFRFGAFVQIANYRGGRAARAATFEIGTEVHLTAPFQDQSEPTAIRITATYRAGTPQPVLHQWRAESEDYSLSLNYPEVSTTEVVVRTPTVEFTYSPRYGSGDPMASLADIDFLRRTVASKGSSFEKFKFEGDLPPESEFDQIESLSDALQFFSFSGRSAGRPRAIAPIRSTPQRTYDPIKDTPTAEGDHVPMVLARAATSKGRNWHRLQNNLIEFGSASGMFRGLDVKRLGDRESNPFQINVKVAGPASNLVDVGYGVNQVLPVLVDSVMLEKSGTMLLQQPEVHLHPRAQAELGSFFGRLVKKDSKQLIVETHSDYLIDRIRMDVRDKREGLTHHDVMILYFQRSGNSVSIYKIGIDEHGNVVGAPDQYRSFFLAEERRFWGD